MKRPVTVVPPLTPFNEDLRVDYDALIQGVDYVIEECDASVVVVAGVEAQEYQFLTLSERKELIQKTVEFVNGRRPVTVGISHPSYKQAIDLAHLASDLGAQSVQLLAPLRPTGGHTPLSDMIDYFDLVGKEIDLPIMLYLNAGPGSDLSIQETIELSKLDCIKYVKESSRDMARVARLTAEIDRSGYADYYVTMQMLLASLSHGASGVTIPPPAAKIANDIINACMAGDYKMASYLQDQLSIFPSKWMSSGLTAVMKSALNAIGIPVGIPYPPYQPVSGKELEDLIHHIQTFDLRKSFQNKG